MAADPIPLLEVRGTYRQVGQQIGEALKPKVQHTLALARESLPPGVSWDEMLRQSDPYLASSRAIYPQYVDELYGIAQGAGVPFRELFLEMCEELWGPAAWQWGGAPAQRGCTDFAARGRATADRSTLLAHTNDLPAAMEEELVLLKVQAGDEPEFLGVSPGGLAFSAGLNAAGISLTGNEVSSNDVRPGVPRLLIVRAILAARRLEEAMRACLLPQRASNYNNVIADDWGEVYSMEGSATDCEPIYIEGDILAHANHYASAPMRRFEADRSEIGGSVLHHNRAWRLLRDNIGQLTPELFQVLLADHANYPNSICKHGVDSVTVFSMIVRPEERRAWIGKGRPCQTTYYEYALEPWTPPEGWLRP